MHRLLLAATLGLGLLSAGGLATTASAHQAAPAPAAAKSAGHTATPVHYDSHRRHYTPPPRHWHRPAPQWNSRHHYQSRYQHPYSNSHSWYSWR
ncbi:MAG: hypothetical protein AB7S57_22030 [Acetobacteraceae bacterium]